MARRTIRTGVKRAAFLAELRQGSSVSRACEVARIGRRAAYEWREDDADFAADWEDAYEDGTDVLEDELHLRAVNGSDTCLIFALKGRRPHRWRPPPQKTVLVQDPDLLRDAEQTRRLREMSLEEVRAELDQIHEMQRRAEEVRAGLPPRKGNGAG